MIVGFVLANFIEYSNLLPIAAIGTAIALATYYNDTKQEKLLEQSNNYPGGDSDGI